MAESSDATDDPPSQDDPTFDIASPSAGTATNDQSQSDNTAGDNPTQHDLSITAVEDSGDASTEPASDVEAEFKRMRERLEALEEKLNTQAASASNVNKRSQAMGMALGVDHQLERKRIHQIRNLDNHFAPKSYARDFPNLVNKVFARQTRDSDDTMEEVMKSGGAWKSRKLVSSVLKKTIDDVGTTSADIVLSNATYLKRPLWISLRDFFIGFTKIVSMRNVMSKGTCFKRKLTIKGESMAWEATEVTQEFPPITWCLLLWPVIVPLWLLCFGTLTLLQFISWRVGRRVIGIPDFSLGLEDTIFTTKNTERDKKKFRTFRKELKMALEMVGHSGVAGDLKVPEFDIYSSEATSNFQANSTRTLPSEILLSYRYLSTSQKNAVDAMVDTLSAIYLNCSQIHFRKIKDRWAVVGSLKQAASIDTKRGNVSKFQLLAHTDAIDERLSEIYELVNRRKTEISHYDSSGNSYQDVSYELDLCGLICSIIIDSIPFGDSTGDRTRGVQPEGPHHQILPSRQTVNTTSFPNTDIEEFLSYTVPAFLSPLSLAFTAANTLITTFVTKDIYEVNTSVLIAFAVIGMYSSIFIDVASSAVNNYIFGGKYQYMHYAPLSHRNVRWTGWFYFDTYSSFIRRQHSLLASYIEKSEIGYVLSNDAGLLDVSHATVVGSDPLHTVKSTYISDAVLEKIGIQLSSTTYVLPTEPNTIVTKVNMNSEQSNALATILLDLWEFIRAFFDIMLGWLIPIFDPLKNFKGREVTDEENRGNLCYNYGCRKAWHAQWYFCCPRFFFKCARCNLLDIKSFTIMHRDYENPSLRTQSESSPHPPAVLPNPSLRMRPEISPGPPVVHDDDDDDEDNEILTAKEIESGVY